MPTENTTIENNPVPAAPAPLAAPQQPEGTGRTPNDQMPNPSLAGCFCPSCCYQRDYNGNMSFQQWQEWDNGNGADRRKEREEREAKRRAELMREAKRRELTKSDAFNFGDQIDEIVGRLHKGYVLKGNVNSLALTTKDGGYELSWIKTAGGSRNFKKYGNPRDAVLAMISKLNFRGIIHSLPPDHLLQ